MARPLTRDEKILIGLVVGTVVLMNVPYGQYPLYPFKLFATWIHESFHGLAALVTGGSVKSVSIHQDTSGLTQFLTSGGRLSSSLITSMGYLGTSVMGAILLALRSRPVAQRWALSLLALGLLLTLVFWVRNLFGMVTVTVLAAAIGLLAVRASDRWASLVTNLLASQACINALLDIRVLYSVQGEHSDAARMANIVGLWPWFWATLWMAISVGLFWLAWSGPRRASPPHATRGPAQK